MLVFWRYREFETTRGVRAWGRGGRDGRGGGGRGKSTEGVRGAHFNLVNVARNPGRALTWTCGNMDVR